VAIEEAVIARLNLLANDRKLLVSLLKSSEGSSKGPVRRPLGTLIDAKNQHRRQTRKAIDSLVATLTMKYYPGRGKTFLPADRPTSLDDETGTQPEHKKNRPVSDGGSFVIRIGGGEGS